MSLAVSAVNPSYTLEDMLLKKPGLTQPQQKSDLHRMVPKPEENRAEGVEKKRAYSKFVRDVALALAYTLVATVITFLVVMMLQALRAHLSLPGFLLLGITGQFLNFLIIILLDRLITGGELLKSTPAKNN